MDPGAPIPAYTISIESRGSFLHVVVRGTNGRATVLGYFEEILLACRPRLALPELFQLGAEVSARAGATLEVLAYVDVNAEDDTVKQVAAVVLEPGSAVGVFNTLPEAEAWLRGKERGAW